VKHFAIEEKGKTMKQHIARAFIEVALALTLLGGAALNNSAAVAHTVPVQRLLACGAPSTPPCS
jgi:hypothetical protein